MVFNGKYYSQWLDLYPSECGAIKVTCLMPHAILCCDRKSSLWGHDLPISHLLCKINFIDFMVSVCNKKIAFDYIALTILLTNILKLAFQCIG